MILLRLLTPCFLKITFLVFFLLTFLLDIKTPELLESLAVMPRKKSLSYSVYKDSAQCVSDLLVCCLGVNQMTSSQE